ncbi:hypothetical protein DL95DRAFT_507491 [Leptodontidium sp. 2 PMI_412]|nr:hypothetical protein DL95DRAFT_507491 [Leptodontidium sp. 2 PMI_412]
MCDYTQVGFRCGHVRYTVRAWCTTYESTHKRCPPSVVAIEFRCMLLSRSGNQPLITPGLNERCGDCRLKSVLDDPSNEKFQNPGMRSGERKCGRLSVNREESVRAASRIRVARCFQFVGVTANGVGLIDGPGCTLGPLQDLVIFQVSWQLLFNQRVLVP